MQEEHVNQEFAKDDEAMKEEGVKDEAEDAKDGEMVKQEEHIKDEAAVKEENSVLPKQEKEEAAVKEEDSMLPKQDNDEAAVKEEDSMLPKQDNDEAEVKEEDSMLPKQENNIISITPPTTEDPTLHSISFVRKGCPRSTPTAAMATAAATTSAATTSAATSTTALIQQMLIVSSKCDYDQNTPGNGYRSLICVCDVAVCQLISILKDCSQNRSNIMFRISHHFKEVEGFASVLRFLILAYQLVIAGMEMFAKDSLFPPLEGEYERYTSFLREIGSLDTSCFYARPLGFQFSPSVARIFRVIGFVLATYSLSWDKEEGPISSFLNSGKYLMSLEQRTLRIVKVIRESDIEFCKRFWNLSELGMMSKWSCPVMTVCDMREITLLGPLPLRTNSGEIILVPEPSSHTGPRPIPYKIISVVAREGLTGVMMNKNALKYSSPHLDAMVAIAEALKHKSMNKFNEAVEKYGDKLKADVVVQKHFTVLHSTMFEKDLFRLVKPYSRVDITHIAKTVGMTNEKVERKLAQMILDKKLYGCLHQGDGVLIVYDTPKHDRAAELDVEVVHALNDVLNALYARTRLIK